MSNGEMIARFMGEPLTLTHDIGNEVVLRQINYDSFYLEWNNLMPVVEKIYHLKDGVKRMGVNVTIKNSKCVITVGKKRFACHTISPLNSTLGAVFEFLTYYNQTKP